MTKMLNLLLEEPLQMLELDSKIIKKLNLSNIYIVQDLWHLKRKNLKELNFTDEEIKQIKIKLQLNSIDLNQKIYH